MADFWLSFRIHDETVGNRSPGERRDALYNLIDKMSTKWWVDTTSFIIFDSEKAIADIAANCKLVIAPSVDTVLIHNVGTKSARAVGYHPHFVTLEGFMSYVDTV